MTTFESLFAARTWKAIPNCPGRFVLADREQHLNLETMAPEIGVREFRVPAARDVVVVVPLQGGGLISYKRADGTYCHTLNNEAGFQRKLAQLGIGLDDCA